MTKKWTDDDTRWLKTNVARLDIQTLALKLGFPLEDVQKRIRQLKLVAAEAPPAPRKSPASLKEAQKELSQARKEYEKAIELFHRRRFDEAARRFEELIEKYPDEKEFRDRAKMYLAACRNGKKSRGTAPSEPEELYHHAVFEKNRGNVDRALQSLKKAIAASDQNRIQARLDTDLAALRGHQGFTELLAGGA